MDRGIEVPPGEAKTRPSGTISNNESGPASLKGYFPCRTMTQNLGRCFKVGLAEYAKTSKNTEMREKKNKQTYNGKGNIYERGKTPLTELDQESVVNRL